MEVLDIQDDLWRRRKGGKKTYRIIVKKYGLEEIRRRQILGGKNSKKHYIIEPFKINLKDPLFLEFYGILLGDGWISKMTSSYD